MWPHNGQPARQPTSQASLSPAPVLATLGGSMEFVPIRLSPGVDLRRALEEAAGKSEHRLSIRRCGHWQPSRGQASVRRRVHRGPACGAFGDSELVREPQRLRRTPAHVCLRRVWSRIRWPRWLRQHGQNYSRGSSGTSPGLVAHTRTRCDNRVQRVGCSPSGVNAECRLTLRSTPTCYGWLRQPSHAGELKR